MKLPSKKRRVSEDSKFHHIRVKRSPGLERLALKQGYANTSEFIRDLVDGVVKASRKKSRKAKK